MNNPARVNGPPSAQTAFMAAIDREWKMTHAVPTSMDTEPLYRAAFLLCGYRVAYITPDEKQRLLNGSVQNTSVPSRCYSLDPAPFPPQDIGRIGRLLGADRTVDQLAKVESQLHDAIEFVGYKPAEKTQVMPLAVLADFGWKPYGAQGMEWLTVKCLACDGTGIRESGPPETPDIESCEICEGAGRVQPDAGPSA